METENENLFELLDISGSEEIFDFYPEKNVLCYSIGCLIVYLDLTENKKFYVKYHTRSIKILKFNKFGNFLISVDEIGKIVNWEIPSLRILSELFIPISFDNQNLMNQINNSIKEIFIEFISYKKFCAISNLINKQSVFYLFETNSNLNVIRINLLFEYKIDLDYFSECFDMKTLNSSKHYNTDMKFASVEERSIKIWNIKEDEFRIELITNVKLKQKLVKSTLQISDNFKLISFMSDEGSILILDFDGNFVICLSPESNMKDDFFVSTCIYEDCLLIGSLLGNLYIYELNGFKLKGIINYEKINFNESGFFRKNFNNTKRLSSFIPNTILNNPNFVSSNNEGLFNLNSLDNNKHYTLFYDNYPNIFPKGPSLNKIFINGSNESNDILIRKFADNSLFITSFKKLITKQEALVSSRINLRDKSINLSSSHESLFNSHFYFNYSHFKRVNDILWLDEDNKMFLTCGEDQSLMKWNQSGDKWINNHLDLLKVFDKNLNNFLNCSHHTLNNNNHFYNNLSFQVLKLHPINQNILVAGDNKGSLHIFNLENASINQLNTLTNSYKKHQLFSFSINYLDFSQIGNFLTVGFETGQVILIDFTNDCQICLILEEHFHDNRYLNLKMIENKFLSFGYIFKIKISPAFDDNSKFKIPKYSSSSFYLKSINNSQNNLKIITLNDMMTFRIQNIIREKTKFLQSITKEVKLRYKLKKAAIHSSEDYIIIVTEINSIEIYRIETNQIVGEIKTNRIVFDFEIDPSGLYIGLLTNNNRSVLNSFMRVSPNARLSHIKSMTDPLIKSNQKFKRSSQSILDQADYSNDFVDRNINESQRNFDRLESLTNLEINNNNIYNSSDDMKNNNKYTIELFEIGTGNYVTSLSNLFDISKFKFSNDGKFLIIASESGCISVWNLPEHILDNITIVLNEVKNGGINEFWVELRINYFIDKENNAKPYLKNSQSENFKKLSENSTTNFKYYMQEQVKNLSSSTFSNKEDKYVLKLKDNNQLPDDIMKPNIKKNSQNFEFKNDNYVKFHKASESRNFNMKPRNSGNELSYNIMTEIPEKNVIRQNFKLSSDSINFSKNFNKNKSNQTQTSFINREMIEEFNKQKEKEWKKFHKYERMGLLNEDYRIINKDPSIYPINIPSVIKKNNQSNKFSFTQINFPVPNLIQAKVEDMSKMNVDLIRSMNIGNAIKEQENLQKDNDKNQSKKDKLLYKDPNILNQSEILENLKNRSLNLNKENKNIFAEKIDLKNDIEIEDHKMPENFSEINPENKNEIKEKSFNEVKSADDNKLPFDLLDNQDNILDQPEKSITDQVCYLNNKIDQFVKMHDFK